MAKELSVETVFIIDAFMLRNGYESWRIEEGNELIFIDKGEPFSIREYVKGTEIQTVWELLQDRVHRELGDTE